MPGRRGEEATSTRSHERERVNVDAVQQRLSTKRQKKRHRAHGISHARFILTEFDQHVFGTRDDVVEVVFGQHQHALVQLDGRLFAGTGIGARGVHQ